MPSKCKFCEHCQQYLSQRTYRRHFDSFFDRKTKQWCKNESSDEETTVSARVISPSGMSIQNLEEGEICLVVDSESEYGSLYHERISPDVLKEMLIFLCMWSLFCSLSESALEILLAFLNAVFESIGMIFPLMASSAVLFPKSVRLLCKQVGLDKDNFIKYVVCPECHCLYNFDDCYESLHGRKVPKKCTVVQPGFAEKCEIWKSREIPDGYLADIFDGKIWKEWQWVDREP
ncbi:uncharacterized protein [Montipora foliosa]|uniref:uncharacterized protein n=1 Tax=Montipora foliosa TaxID=591990 RepID=UPI0035F17D18